MGGRVPWLGAVKSPGCQPGGNVVAGGGVTTGGGTLGGTNAARCSSRSKSVIRINRSNSLTWRSSWMKFGRWPMRFTSSR